MNLGLGDRIVRLIGGCGVVVFDYFSSAQWEIIFLIVGLWTVGTSVIGHCPFLLVTRNQHMQTQHGSNCGNSILIFPLA
ncbi:MAG: hypothetical protein Ct9H90mP16_10970 [Candidatus Poseidoniales archaeon]|nr:MAG: hypothetical protein Ct9H90mP16_10970 [Candidatus Poseidoniales archaeon]